VDDWRPGALPGDPDWMLQVVIPDDARELDPDVEAYRRELRARARQRHPRTLAGRRLQQYGVPLTLLALILVMVTGIGGMLNLVRPGQGVHVVRAQPLARVGEAPQTAHGLMPDEELRIAGAEVLALVYRPAVFALLPNRCGCPGLVDELSGQAQEFNFEMVAVGPQPRDAEVARLADQATHGTVVAADDTGARLRTLFAAAGVTVLVVAADGRVVAVDRAVSRQTRLEAQLWQASR
jgi:PAS domain-containing protein